MPRMKNGIISVSTTVDVRETVDVDVDLDIQDFVEGLSDVDARKLMDALAEKLGNAATPTPSRMLEDFYIATSRGDERAVMALAPQIVREFAGRIV